MNILEIQEALKGMSEQQLVKEMQQPSGNAPSFLVLTELERRKNMKERFNAQQPKEPTVAEEAVMGGLGSMMPQTMPPQQMMPQQQMQQPMRMQVGGLLRSPEEQRLIDEENLLRQMEREKMAREGIKYLGGIPSRIASALAPRGEDLGEQSNPFAIAGDETPIKRGPTTQERIAQAQAEGERQAARAAQEAQAAQESATAPLPVPVTPTDGGIPAAAEAAAVAQAAEGQTPDSFLSQYLELMKQQREAGQQARERSKYLALAQAGQALTASDRPLLQAVSQATGAGLKGLMAGEQAFRQSEADYLKSLGTLASAEMKAKGKQVSVGNLVDLVETLQKDIMLLPEEEQESRRQQIREIQQLIRERIGLQGGTTGGMAGVSLEAIDAEVRRRLLKGQSK